MLIKAVELHNIRSYIKQRIEFPLGSTLLAGDIGSGKSTILLGIEFALFGILRGALEGDALLRHGSNSGSVILELEIDKKNIVIKRALKRTRNGINQDYGFISIDGIKTEGTPLELKAQVLELLGYPMELGRSKDLIYRFTVYTPQEDMKRILSEDKELRLETLRKVFQIDKYKRLRENAEIVLRELKNIRKEKLIRFESLDEEQKRKLDLEKRFEDISSQCKDLENELNSVVENKASLEKSLKAIEAEFLFFHELRTKLGSIMASVQEKTRLKSTLERECKLSQESLENKGKRLENSSGLKKTIQELSEKIKYKEKIKVHIEELEGSMQNIQRAISQHETLIKEAKNRKKEIETLDKCPMCEQIVNAAHKENITKRESSLISELESHAIFSQAERKRIESQLKAVKQHLNDIIEAEKVLARLNAEDKIVSDLSAEIMSLKERLKINYKQMEDLAAELENLSAEKVSIDLRFRDYEDIALKQRNFREKLENVLDKEKELLVNKAMLTKEAENVKKIIDELNNEIEKMEKSKEEASKLLEKLTWLSNYFIPVLDLIERNVMLKTHSQFDEYFKNWFSILMEDEAITARLDEEFTPLIEQDGYEVSVDNLSGGEKTSCALAYRLALAKVVNDIVSPIKTQDLIILDEPTDGFSTEQLDRIKDVLEQLHFGQVIIVSHEPKMESFVDNIIRLKKSETQTIIFAGAVV